MEQNFKIELTESTVENLTLFTELLNKDVNTILEEALELYFTQKQKEMAEKSLEEEHRETTFEYDEFWDGLDLT
jgi:hypothetical protein